MINHVVCDRAVIIFTTRMSPASERKRDRCVSTRIGAGDSLVSRESARLPSSGRGSRRTITPAPGRSDPRGALHSTSFSDSLRGGRGNRPGRSQRRRRSRSDRPKHRRASLASVSSDRAHKTTHDSK